MEKKFIKTIISICVVISFSICIYFYNVNKNENVNNDKNINNNINNNIKLDLKEENSISKKALLYGIINSKIESNTSIEVIEKEISTKELKSGIWISERAREIFVDILYDSTKIKWNIDKKGYLEEPTNQISSNEVLSNKIVEFIKDNSKLIVIDYSETYKGVINAEILDFMVERTSYVEKLKYNECLQINIINPIRYIEENEEISEKEKCEEILINIFT